MRTDVVIPARNVETTISPILDTLRLCSAINNIIVCIDADSTDDTEKKAHKSRVKLLPSDLGIRGKGQLIRAGLKWVESDHVLFMDSDYIGFTNEHLRVMTTAPHRAILIGVPEFPYQDVPPQVISSWPWVSGIRLVPTPLVASLELHGYLMEVQINQEAARIGLGYRFRHLTGLTSPYRMTPLRAQERERDRVWGLANGVLK